MCGMEKDVYLYKIIVVAQNHSDFSVPSFASVWDLKWYHIERTKHDLPRETNSLHGIKRFRKFHRSETPQENNRQALTFHMILLIQETCIKPWKTLEAKSVLITY